MVAFAQVVLYSLRGGPGVENAEVVVEGDEGDEAGDGLQKQRAGAGKAGVSISRPNGGKNSVKTRLSNSQSNSWCGGAGGLHARQSSVTGLGLSGNGVTVYTHPRLRARGCTPERALVQVGGKRWWRKRKDSS